MLLPAEEAALFFSLHGALMQFVNEQLRIVGAEGERACPPEDVGGIDGYARYLEAMADPSHDRHQEMLAWRGPFNPDAFDSCRTTHIMQEGLPDWRKMGGATELEA